MDPDTLLRHAGFVRAIARGLLAADDAEDVVQDTMLAAWQRPPRDPSRARAWLGAVGRRLSLKRLRGDRRRDARERVAARPEALPSAAEVAGQLEIQRKVVEAVVALDEPYRSTVVHRFLHERSVAEIAQALGVPRKTIESRLTRALAMLRARLDADHGGRRAWSVALLPLAWPRRATTGALGGLIMTTKMKSTVAAALLAIAGVGVVGVGVLGRRGGEPAARVEARRDREGNVASPDFVAAREPAGDTREPEAIPVAAPALPPVPPAPPGGIVGRITCADGAAAAGARVRAGGVVAAKDGSVAFGPGATTLEHEAETDKHGVYRFEGLEPGSYKIHATHPGHAPTESGAWHTVSARRGAQIDLQLKLGGTLCMLVRDVAGAVFEGAEVELHAGIVSRDGQELSVALDPPLPRSIARVVSDASGMAVMEHLEQGGTIRVRAAGEEHLRTCILVRDRETTVVGVVVGALATGVVELEDGTPVRSASVRFFGPMNAAFSAAQAEAPLDGTGRYAIRWLVPGEYGVRVQGAGIASGFQRVEVGPEPMATVPLRLAVPAVLGRVRHERFANMYVTLKSSDPGGALTVAPAADGSFGFYDVRPGEYLLSVREHGADVDATLPIVVRPGSRIAGIEVEPRPRGYGDVELEIIDAKGAYTGHVQLYVGDETSSTSILPSSVGPGRFRFRVAAGRSRIYVQWTKGTETVDVDIPEGQTTVRTVRLP